MGVSMIVTLRISAISPRIIDRRMEMWIDSFRTSLLGSGPDVSSFGKHFKAGSRRAARVVIIFLDDFSRFVLGVVVGTAESAHLVCPVTLQ